MKVFHLGWSKYAGDLTGIGAELNGGRWNNEGIPCIYTSSFLSLAVLEYAVNNSLENIPRALSYTIYDIPDTDYLKLKISSLPGNWADHPAPISTMDFGSKILKENKNLVITIPSVIIPEEYNYLINPNHADIGKVKIMEIKDFTFDIRVKQ